MIISGIVAMGPKREIGLNNQMLWHIKEDWKHFKQTTMGHHLIMGRKTFDSIGKPLPGRTTIVLTRRQDFSYPGVLVTDDPEKALAMAREAGDEEVFIAGGAQIYALFKEHYDKIYLSHVDYQGQADTYFPELNLDNWQLDEKKEYQATETSPAWRLEVWHTS